MILGDLKSYLSAHKRVPIADIAKNRKSASELVDKVGFDDGPSS